MDKIKSMSAILIIGVLVIEDLVAIVIISVLHSGIISGSSFDFMQILMIICEIGLFIGGTIVAGTLVMPRIFALIAKLERYEITIMSALGTAFGLAFLSHQQLGFSAATGGFLAGVIIAGSNFSEQISIIISPIREIFAAIFFVSIGMLMDLSVISEYCGCL
jgi:monovalent cation:H+ antiporter-2, CPA2 family